MKLFCIINIKVLWFMCMRKYGFANTWISRKWIQFGVTIRMGHCRDMRDNCHSKKCLLKPGKSCQCRTGDGDWIGLGLTWLVIAQMNAGERTALYGQGSCRSATHFVLCLMQFVGKYLNPRKCWSTCLYKWMRVWNNCIHWEMYRLILCCMRKRCCLCLSLWSWSMSSSRRAIRMYMCLKN